MERLFFDYIYDDTKEIVMNELLAFSRESALEFISDHYLDLHRDGENTMSALRLRTADEEVLVEYTMHWDAISSEP